MDLAVAAVAIVAAGVVAVSLYRQAVGYRIERHRQQRADRAAMSEFENRRHLL